MRYGLNLPNGGADPQTLGEFASLAEKAGWDGVFLEDYIIWQGHQDIPTYDPWVILAAMALRTEHVRLGTMVTPLTRRRPWKIARETATLDHLSRGRLILGIGLGDTISSAVNFTHFGEIIDSKQRAEMLDEGLDVLVGLWSGEPFSYHGEYYHVNEVTFLPRPLQTPRIPIWVGGGYPLKGPMRRAARWDGACLYNNVARYMQPGDVRDLKVFIEDNRAASGPFEIVVGGHRRRDDWEEERAHIRSLAEVGVTWWIEYVPPDDLGAMRACIERGPLRAD
jgi:alkanesulfonate monooxygenase SsuD/methylene tetrahydromethanopterin reductase-like flavin-dependent oxidoreductase (luciferase family)